MNLTKAIAGLALFAFPAACSTDVRSLQNTAKEQQHHANRNFVGNSVWVFGGDGVTIFNPDGSEKKKEIAANDICHEVIGYRGNPEAQTICSFYDVISDGKKYVWAAVTRGVAKIDILDIDTGDVVGSFETCTNPTQLEYHPLREEIWVRCSELHPNSETPTYMDVFSASSPSVSIETDVFFSSTFESGGSPASKGYTVVDNSLGDVGYITDRDQPYIFKLDLSTKKVIDKFDLPLAYGGVDAAYSRVNKHIYVRSDVCCTCGFEGADALECPGRYTPELVNVTTGNQAGQNNVLGACFWRCHGYGADTLGVYEFDTTTDTIVGSHLMKEGFTGDPFPSPDGKYIVMIGRNGGSTIRVLKPGAASEKSTLLYDLELKFNNTGNEDEDVFSDFAFVDLPDKNLLVFASGTENKAAIIDLSDVENPVYVVLKDDGESTARWGSSRDIEWAVGTHYVWIGGDDADEIYVLDVMKKELVRTITEKSSSKILSVVNFEKMNAAKRQQEMIDATIASYVSGDSSSEEGVSENNLFNGGSSNDNDNNIDNVGIIGLVIGCVSLVVGAVNIYAISGMKNQKQRGRDDDDAVSLGSKDVA